MRGCEDIRSKIIETRSKTLESRLPAGGRNSEPTIQ